MFTLASSSSPKAWQWWYLQYWGFILFSYWCSSQRLHLKDPHAPIAQPPFLAPATNPIMSERIETHNYMPKQLTLCIVGRKIPFCALGEDKGRLWTAITCLRIEAALLCMIGRQALPERRHSVISLRGCGGAVWGAFGGICFLQMYIHNYDHIQQRLVENCEYKYRFNVWDLKVPSFPPTHLFVILILRYWFEVNVLVCGSVS